MRKVLLTIMVGLTFIAGTVKAQEIQMTILAIPGAIVLGQTGVIQVDLCNIDANPVTAPANKLRPIVSVANNVEITGVTNMDGTPLTGFTIQSQTTNTVRLLYNPELPNAECVSYLIKIKGVVLSENEVITGTLGFNGPPTPGNSLINDVPTTGVEVIVDPLPVKLVNFDVKKEGSQAQLVWATTAETNSDRFEIEHSLTGKSWNKIGTVASFGESIINREYMFSDKNVSNGDNLYRLKMVDKDATFAYSSIRSVKFDGLDTDLSVYPNPVADVLKIRDYSQVTKVSINDMNGRTVHESGKTSTGEISVRNLTSGIYLVRVNRANGLTSSQKIVVGK